MLSGGLKTRIKVFKRESITTASGAEELQYTETLTTWAQVVSRSASLREEINARFDGMTLQLNVRYEHPIKVEDRIVLENEPDYTYVVVERTPNFQRDMVSLTIQQIHD